MSQETINQLLSQFSFSGMEIKMNITKNDKGLEIFGTIMPQNSDGNKSEKPEVADACGQKLPSASAEPEYKYTVRSVKQSGKGSQLLELVSRNGEVTAAYVKAGTQAITVGSRLTDVDIQQKSGTYGNYNLINACQVAA